MVCCFDCMVLVLVVDLLVMLFGFIVGLGYLRMVWYCWVVSLLVVVGVVCWIGVVYLAFGFCVWFVIFDLQLSVAFVYFYDCFV